MGNYLALYLRLSLEDMDVHGDSPKDESNSIQSQRAMLRNYVNAIPALADRPILEFVDDGYTGTNFDRPEFQKMMDRIRTGDVTCIVVKDLSRFGRNYLEVGDYLEHLFPFLGVRFIAINNHYDSQDYVGSTGGMDVAFRNLIYQRYSQDLSEKVKAAKHMKMAQGKHICGCPYGYKKKPGIKDQMFIDPEAGVVFTAGGLFYHFEKEQVRRLFCAMAERFPGGMIAFDAVNALGLKGVNAEVKMAGESAGSYFSLKKPREELESWSERIVNVVEKDYMNGYLKGGYRPTAITRFFHWVMQVFHMSFMLHVEFWEESK